MKLTKLACAALCVSTFATTALADVWPTKPIKLIIPFAAGGSTDVVGRIAAEFLGKELGQPVVSDNRGGAGGSLGAAVVANAPGDGYTIGVATVSTHVTNPVLMKLSYDPEKALTPIVQIAASPNVLEVNDKLPAKTFKEFVALMKSSPDKYNFGSGGLGSVNHIMCESLMAYTGTSMVHVPYKGAGLAMTDLLSGEVQVMCDQVSASLQFIKAGKLRALAVSAPSRLPYLPDVPTFAELGYPDLNPMAWYGLMAPGSTPKPIIDKINAAMVKILKLKEYQDAIVAAGSLPAGGSKAEFEKIINDDLVRIRAIVKEKNIKLQ